MVPHDPAAEAEAYYEAQRVEAELEQADREVRSIFERFDIDRFTITRRQRTERVEATVPGSQPHTVITWFYGVEACLAVSNRAADCGQIELTPCRITWNSPEAGTHAGWQVTMYGLYGSNDSILGGECIEIVGPRDKELWVAVVAAVELTRSHVNAAEAAAAAKYRSKSTALGKLSSAVVRDNYEAKTAHSKKDFAP